MTIEHIRQLVEVWDDGHYRCAIAVLGNAAIEAMEKLAAVEAERDRLDAIVSLVRPLFDAHGPSFGSVDWVAAWNKADAALK